MLDNHMLDDHELLKMIDCCRADKDGRPNSDDLAGEALRPLADILADSPAARDLFARAKQTDARLRAAMVDVPVPYGLADRILQRLAAGSAAASDLVVNDTVSIVLLEDSSTDAATAPSERQFLGGALAPVPRGPRGAGRALWTRRYWLATGLATAAGIAVVVSWYGSPVHYTPESLLEAARQFDASAPREEGTLLAQSRPHSSFRASERIVTPPTTRWRTVDGFLGRTGVAYDLSMPRGASATLYVVQLGRLPNAPHIDTARLRSSPSANPQPASGGARMATWREEGRLYVLVVHGDDNAYRRLIRPAPAIASIDRHWAAECLRRVA
jgi:hypothetical protein